MFPMKFFEYLAAGKQVVATHLDALKEYEQQVYLSKSIEGYIQNIDLAIENPKSSQDELFELAKKHTYQGRMQKMLHEVEALN